LNKGEFLAHLSAISPSKGELHEVATQHWRERSAFRAKSGRIFLGL
jgi:hypothetical protein